MAFHLSSTQIQPWGRSCRGKRRETAAVIHPFTYLSSFHHPSIFYGHLCSCGPDPRHLRDHMHIQAESHPGQANSLSEKEKFSLLNIRCTTSPTPKLVCPEPVWAKRLQPRCVGSNRQRSLGSALDYSPPRRTTLSGPSLHTCVRVCKTHTRTHVCTHCLFLSFHIVVLAHSPVEYVPQ